MLSACAVVGVPRPEVVGVADAMIEAVVDRHRVATLLYIRIRQHLQTIYFYTFQEDNKTNSSFSFQALWCYFIV